MARKTGKTGDTEAGELETAASPDAPLIAAKKAKKQKTVTTQKDKEDSSVNSMRGITWAWVDLKAWSPDKPLLVHPVALPGGGPDRAFWMLQDGGDLNLRNGFAQRAILEGRRQGKATLIVQIICAVKAKHFLPVFSPSEWDAVEFLSVHELNVENRFSLVEVLRNRLPEREPQNPALIQKVLKACRGSVHYWDLFADDPGGIGEATFLALPKLRMISWEVSFLGKDLPRLSAVSFSSLSVVESCEVIMPGYGKLSADVKLQIPAIAWSTASEEERAREYLPWV